MNAAMGNSVPARRPGASIGAKPDPVTAGLQQLFASIENEPIPDDFLRLLDEIEASSKRAGEPPVGDSNA